MAKHKFDGRWKYFDLDDRDFPPDDPQQDGEMILDIDDDGTGHGHLKATSHHEGGQPGNVLTGDADQTHIVFRETKGADVDLSYEGFLLPEFGNRLVLVGTYKDNKLVPQRKKLAQILTDGQNDGTWVMTKP